MKIATRLGVLMMYLYSSCRVNWVMKSISANW